MAKKTKTNERIPFCPECSIKGCQQPALLLPDRITEPSKQYFERKRVIVTDEGEEIEEGGLTSVVSFPSGPTENCLCYYHTKVKEGYFDAIYPLKGWGMTELGYGGLESCPMIDNRTKHKPAYYER